MRRAALPGMGRERHRVRERDEGTSLGWTLFTQVLSCWPAVPAMMHTPTTPHTNIPPCPQVQREQANTLTC